MPGSSRLLLLGIFLLSWASPAAATLGANESLRYTSNWNGLGQLDSNAGFGRSAARISDLNGDGHDDLLVGRNGGISVLMLDGDLQVIGETLLEPGSNGVPVEMNQVVGGSLAVIGDLDLDGTADVAAGVPFYNGGWVWILFLNPDGTVKATQPLGSFNIPGLPDGEPFARSLEFLGDRDEDGLPELVVGAGSALWILELNSDGTVAGSDTIASGEVGLGPYGTIFEFAWAVTAVGDLDGNGHLDLAVGSRVGLDGMVSILFLDSSDSVIETTIIGEGVGGFEGGSDDYFGQGLAWVRDTVCDRDYLAVGVPSQYESGKVWLLEVDGTGSVIGQTELTGDESTTGAPGFWPPVVEDTFGQVATVGDLDGDGVDELAVANPEFNYGMGELWIMKLAGERIAPRGIDFGYVFTDDSADSSVTLINDGCSTVSGSLVMDGDDFQILSGGGAFSLDPGESLSVDVRFAPVGGNFRTGTLLTGSAFGEVAFRGVGRVPTTPCFGHWNLDTFNASNLGPGPENHALWCGVQAGEPGYPLAPGFGSFWDEPIVWVGPVPPFAESNHVRVRFDYNMDVTTYDEFYVEYLSLGSWVRLFETSGSTRDSTGVFSDPAEVDLSFDALATDRVLLDGVPSIALRLRFKGGQQFTDENFLDTDGAVQVDNLQIWIDGELVSDADFEPEGNDGGWCADPQFVVPETTNAWHTGYEAPPTGMGMDGAVRSMLVYEGQLVVGGEFTQAGSTPANRVAAFDGVQWHALGDGFADGAVGDLVEFGGALYAGGSFTLAGGSPADYLATWNGVEWQPAGVTPQGPVGRLGVWDGNLWVPESELVNSQWSRWVRPFDGVQWGDPIAVPDPVTSMIGYQGSLYITTNVDYGADGGLYRLDGTEFTEIVMVDDVMFDTVVHEGLLIVGGGWNTAPPGGSARAVGWDGTGWVPQPAPPFGDLVALTVYNGRVVAGGQMAPPVTSWENGVLRPMGVGGYTPYTAAVVEFDGSLWAGGFFTTMGGKPSSYIARWTDPGPVAVPGAPDVVRSGVKLSRGVPNPFNPKVSFRFSVPERGAVRATVHDLRGRRVATLLDEDFEAGTHDLSWGGRDGHGRSVASGAYFVRVEHPAGTAVRRVILLK